MFALPRRAGTGKCITASDRSLDSASPDRAIWRGARRAPRLHEAMRGDPRRCARRGSLLAGSSDLGREARGRPLRWQGRSVVDRHSCVLGNGGSWSASWCLRAEGAGDQLSKPQRRSAVAIPTFIPTTWRIGRDVMNALDAKAEVSALRDIARTKVRDLHDLRRDVRDPAVGGRSVDQRPPHPVTLRRNPLRGTSDACRRGQGPLRLIGWRRARLPRRSRAHQDERC